MSCRTPLPLRAVLRRPFDGFCFVGLFGDGDGDNAYFGCFILLRNKAFSGYLIKFRQQRIE